MRLYVCHPVPDTRPIPEVVTLYRTISSRISITIVAAVLILILPLYAAAATHPDWKNALKPSGNPGDEITVTDDGDAVATIIVPADPTGQEQKASGDLRQWLNEMTAVELTVRGEDAETTYEGPVISVGRTQMLQRAGLPSVQDDLGDEGYGIATDDGNLYLFGGSQRGPIYAVYALLEEDLGCRWYGRDSATIPDRTDLTFRPVPRTFVPKLQIRAPFWWYARDRDWSLRNRTNAYRADIPEKWGGHVNYPGGWFVHTFDRLVSPENYFDEHPGYFSLVDGERIHHIPGRRPGQLCLTNENVLRIAIKKVRAVLEKHPNAELISVSENDGRAGQCECDRCRAINEREGTKAGTLVKFVNAVAEAIASDYPDVKITTLAYGPTFKPPKTIKPRDNVMIRVCTDMHAWPHPYLKVTETDKFQNALKGWAALGADISIWDYTTNFGAYIRPHPNMPVVGDNIRFYIDNNARGIMLQGAYQSAGADRAPMRSWVWAKQLWKPSLSTRSLMRDFIYGYYGKSERTENGEHENTRKTANGKGTKDGKGKRVEVEKTENGKGTKDSKGGPRKARKTDNGKYAKYGNAATPIWEYNNLLWNDWKAWHERPVDNRKQKYPVDNETIARGLHLLETAEKLADTDRTLKRVRLAKLPVLYETLQSGPESKQRLDDYLAMVDEFENIARANNVTHLQERPRGIEQQLLKWRAMAGRIGISVPVPGTVVADDIGLSLAKHLEGAAPKVVEDRLAGNGYAIRQPGGNSAWSIQWKHFVEQVRPDTTYRLRVKMRADKKADEGQAFHAGVYRTSSREYPVPTKGFDAADVKSNEYTWFTIGEWKPDDSDMVYIAPNKNMDNVTAVYTDRIELVPVDGESD